MAEYVVKLVQLGWRNMIPADVPFTAAIVPTITDDAPDAKARTTYPDAKALLLKDQRKNRPAAGFPAGGIELGRIKDPVGSLHFSCAFGCTQADMAAASEALNGFLKLKNSEVVTLLTTVAPPVAAYVDPVLKAMELLAKGLKWAGDQSYAGETFSYSADAHFGVGRHPNWSTEQYGGAYAAFEIDKV